LAAAYGANATVAKTEEELEDRHRALFGDADNADDITIDLPASNGHAYEDHVNGDAGRNGNAQMQNGGNGTGSSHTPRVCLSACCLYVYVYVRHTLQIYM
jgi:hypothetical protein